MSQKQEGMGWTLQDSQETKRIPKGHTHTKEQDLLESLNPQHLLCGSLGELLYQS